LDIESLAEKIGIDNKDTKSLLDFLLNQLLFVCENKIILSTERPSVDYFISA
jgi:hypothetical protein